MCRGAQGCVKVCVRREWVWGVGVRWVRWVGEVVGGVGTGRSCCAGGGSTQSPSRASSSVEQACRVEACTNPAVAQGPCYVCPAVTQAGLL